MIARIRRLCNTITYTGIWIQPIMMVALHRVLRLIYWRRGISWQEGMAGCMGYLLYPQYLCVGWK